MDAYDGNAAVSELVSEFVNTLVSKGSLLAYYNKTPKSFSTFFRICSMAALILLSS